MIAELDSSSSNDSLFVRFSMQPVENKARTVAEGRPIFDDKEYIEISTPGDRTNMVHRRVTDADKQRFGHAYRSWQANADTGGLTGTPLAKWGNLPPSQVMELAHFNCRTVEQLAGMSDANLRNVGAILELRKKAQAYLESAKHAAPVEVLQAELAKRDAQIDALTRQMADVVAKFEAKKK